MNGHWAIPIIASIVFILTLSPVVSILPPANASPGDVLSTVEINDSTNNGPVLFDSDRFGVSIANIGDLDGDGVQDLAVGAHFDNGAGFFQGAVHIMFMNTDGSIKSTVEINDSTNNGPVLSNNDTFGNSIANIGDLDGDGVQDLAVGAPGDGGAAFLGAIHIMFMNTDGSIKSTVKINASTTNGPVLSNLDILGDGVTNIGDLDGDGVQDLAAGARGDDGAGVDRGAIHIMFMNTDGSIKSTVEINDSTNNGPVLSNNDFFGSSIANIGDLDGDGVQDLAVGAIFDDNSGVNRGAIHIMFMNTDGSIKSTVEINDSTNNGPVLSNNDRFGVSVANIGDLDGDGVQDLVVGANHDIASPAEPGAIHIMFMNTDGSIKSTVEINASTPNGPVLSNLDRFGTSVANIGDLNGDGLTDLAVGAIGDAGAGSLRGAVHIMFIDSVTPETEEKKSCDALDKASESGKGKKKGLERAKANNDC